MGQPLGGPQLAQLLLAEGATPQQAATWVAIARRESGLDPTQHNGKPPDNSYGLFQVNMIGPLGIARRRQLGLSSNEDLYDPMVSVRAARALSNDWSDVGPWRVPGATPFTGLDLPRAQQDVAAAMAGNFGQNDTGSATPVGPNMPGATPAGASVQIPLGEIAGVTIGPTFDSGTLVRVGLCVLGGLVVLVGLWVTFQGSERVQKAASGAQGAPAGKGGKTATGEAEEVAAA